MRAPARVPARSCLCPTHHRPTPLAFSWACTGLYYTVLYWPPPFPAGIDTTAHTMAWTLYLLAQHPEAEAQVCAELDALGLLATAEVGVGRRAPRLQRELPSQHPTPHHSSLRIVPFPVPAPRLSCRDEAGSCGAPPRPGVSLSAAACCLLPRLACSLTAAARARPPSPRCSAPSRGRWSLTMSAGCPPLSLGRLSRWVAGGGGGGGPSPPPPHF